MTKTMTERWYPQLERDGITQARDEQEAAIRERHLDLQRLHEHRATGLDDLVHSIDCTCIHCAPEAQRDVRHDVTEGYSS
jgi:hypothetical protein